MSLSMDFHGQIASIMEVLANAAVAEICKVVDDGYAVVQLEMSQNHKENEFLKRKIKLMELQIAKLRAERRCQDGTLLNRFHGVQLLNRQNRERANSAGLTMKSRFRNWDVRTHTAPTEAPVEKSPHVIVSSKVGSDDMEEGEPDLLIIKEEKPEEPKALDQETEESGRCLESAYDVDDDAPFLPSAVAVEPRTRHADVEVSGSDSVHKSEAESEGLKHSLPHTGSELSTKRLNHTNAAELVHNGQSPSTHTVNKEWTDLGVIPSSLCQATETGSMCLEERPVGVGDGNSVSIPCSSASEMQPDVIVVEPETPGHSVQSSISWRQKLLSSHGEVTEIRQGSNSKAQGITNASAQQCHESHRENVMQPQYISISSSSDHSSRPCPMMAPTVGNRVHGEGTQIHDIYHTQVVEALGRNVPLSDVRSRRPISFTLPRPFGCTGCQKKFVTEQDLKKHQAIHRRAKAFPCSLCGKCFVSASQLHMHRNVHTGDKPYSCHLCWRRFSHPSNLKRHQKQVH